jgi:hypothetical protein
MATVPYPSNKRRREQANRKRIEEKAQRRQERAREREERGTLIGDGDDPDLVGIVPGPQPEGPPDM